MANPDEFENILGEEGEFDVEGGSEMSGEEGNEG